jgi:hypothetical protein
MLCQCSVMRLVHALQLGAGIKVSLSVITSSMTSNTILMCLLSSSFTLTTTSYLVWCANKAQAMVAPIILPFHILKHCEPLGRVLAIPAPIYALHLRYSLGDANQTHTLQIMNGS